jgi:hypothetical protein
VGVEAERQVDVVESRGPISFFDSFYDKEPEREHIILTGPPSLLSQLKEGTSYIVKS